MSIETQGRRRAAKYIAKMQAKRKTCETCGRVGLKAVKVPGGFGYYCKTCAKVNDEYMDRDIKTDKEIKEQEAIESRIVDNEVKKSIWERIGLK